MRGVTFGDKHSYFDWGLTLRSAPIISAPKPKEKYVNVPGADGTIDLSTAISGKMRYEDRDLTIEFVLVARRDTWADVYSGILADAHGQKMDIVFDDDRNYCYTGRVTVGDLKPENNMVAMLTITAKVAPYKKPIGSTTNEGGKL